MKISTLSQSMKKVSKLVQNIFASPLRHLKTQGRLPPKRTVAENPGCWLHVLASTKLGPKVHNPGGGGGWGGSHREAFLTQKLVIFFTGKALSSPYCAGLTTGSQPSTHKQGE